MILKRKLDQNGFTSALTFFLVFASFLVKAQNLTVGMANIEDFYRRNQLLGLTDSTLSFTIRPLRLPLNAEIFDATPLRWGESENIKTQKKLQFGLLPINWKQQYNSHHPYGWNDGSMIPAKGYETLVSAGTYLKFGPLAVQLQPEFVYAANNAFKIYPGNYNGNDVPQRFGDGNYSHLNWGQSQIRLNFGVLSFGLSNENLWWGPGLKNSLLITNNAAGFKHLTFNTAKPIHTFIGSFEGQMIGGRLENSGYLFPKSNNWRYLSGLAISYNPKWTPGLFLGLTRTFQTYQSNLHKFSDYIPLFRPFQKVNDKNQNVGQDGDDQITSIFGRWMFTKAHAEVYFEFGENDHAYNIRDFLIIPEHSRSYLFGMRKLFALRAERNEYLQLGLEVTQLEQSISALLRDAGSWYQHFQIFEGHTNKGEVLGAGIGPGGNLQTFDISWFKGYKHLGLQLERYEHQADFYNSNFRSLNKDNRWVDFSMAAVTDWNYKHLIFNAKLQGIKSVNYLWSDGALKESPFNIHAELGLTYLFN